MMDQLAVEIELIGGLLRSPEWLADVRTLCKPSDLTNDGLAQSLEWLSTAKLKADGGPHDARMWLTWVAKKKIDLKGVALEGPLSHAEVARRVSETANAAGVEHAAKWLSAAAVDRDLRKLAGRLASAGSLVDESTDLDGPRRTLEIAAKTVADIQARATTGEPKHIRELVSQAMREINARFGENAVPLGVETGFNQLDGMLAGMRAGELLILAARPGVGKTALALNIASHVAGICGKQVLFSSLEMGAIELTERVLSSVSEVCHHNMRAGRLGDGDPERIAESAGLMSAWGLEVDDRPSQRVLDIIGGARRKQMRGGLDLLVVDYLQLIAPDNTKETRQEQVAKISRSLKQAAKSLGVPVLCLAQLNRQADGNEPPRLSHLRESGSIEQDADVVMFIHREQQANAYDKAQASLIVAKQRNGPTGEVRLDWHESTVRFTEAGPEPVEELAAFGGPRNEREANRFR